MQKPHPPIWVGGESGPSLRRAARFGDAWYPIGSNNQHLLDSLPRLESGIARLRQATAAVGRDPASVEVAFRVKRYGAAVPPKASDGERRLFSGSEADLIGDLRALPRAGQHVAAPNVDVMRQRDGHGIPGLRIVDLTARHKDLFDASRLSRRQCHDIVAGAQAPARDGP